jgi:beta-phosphoglucomutase
MEVTALIFDMDGVIVDSTALHTDAWRLYLEQQGQDAFDIADRMLGKHNDELVRMFFPREALTAESIFEHGRRKEAIYRGMMAPVVESKLVPGVRDFILRHQSSPLAIATNAEPLNVDFILDATAIRSYFRVILDGHQVAKPKPFPDIYLAAAERLGQKPEDCVVFEDSLTGIAAARASGARVVGVSTTLPSFADADLTIQDFLDPKLEPWLQQLTVSR